MAFFCYNQNNSGGSFDNDSRVTLYVIVEAEDASKADDIAEGIGVYFDGCDSGRDCSCCGDRWYRTYGDGDESPVIYGDAPEKYRPTFADVGEVYCRVYFANGVTEEYRKQPKPKAKSQKLLKSK